MYDNTEQSAVYHYCSLDSFMSIMKQGCIRMGNIKKSNDSGEIQYYSNALEKTLRRTCIYFANQHIENEELKRFFREIDYNDLIMRAVKNDSLIYYVSCFSTELDLLSQWRSYADDGRGIAIGFHVGNFMSACDGKNLMFNKIKYNIENVTQELETDIFEKLMRVHAKGDLQCSYEIAINKFISKIVYDAVFYKNSAFQEEHEWRLVFYPFGNIRNLYIPNRSMPLSSNQLFYDRMCEIVEYPKKYSGLYREKLDFKITDNQLVSYVAMNFSKVKDTMISDIVIGPKSKIDEKELNLFLMANGYDLSRIKIKRSKATYQ